MDGSIVTFPKGKHGEPREFQLVAAINKFPNFKGKRNFGNGRREPSKKRFFVKGMKTVFRVKKGIPSGVFG